MFKILILQRYFNLSDDQTEFQIKYRLSFMDFLNLELSDKIPDAKTIWLFKERLSKNGLTEKLFDLFTETLNAKGIIAKEGSMVCLLYTSPSPRDRTRSRMPSSA